MNATPNTKPFRPRKKSTAIAPTPFNELPLSGANTEDEFGASTPPHTMADPQRKSGEALPAAGQLVSADESSPAPRSAGDSNSAAASLPSETPVSANDKLGLAAAEPSTALTVPERARLLLKSEQTERDFNAMVENSRTITAVTNADGRTQCHSLLMDYVDARTSLDKTDKTAREDLVALNKGIIAEKNRLAGIISPEETRLRALRDEWDAEIARQKRVKAEAEAARVKHIQGLIEFIRSLTEMAFGQPSKAIEEAIKDLVAAEIGEEFAEFKDAAAAVKDATLNKLRTMHQAALDSEEKERKLAEDRAELERQKANERRVTAIRKRISHIREFANDLVGVPAIRVLQSIEEAKAFVVDSSFEELKVEAEGERIATVQRLERVHAAAVEHEAERERLAREKVEQETAAAKERARIADENRKADEARQARERAMDAIRVIQDRLADAAEGDTLEAYDLAVSLTQAEPITEERFGAMLATARTVQTNTLTTLQQRRIALAKRLLSEAELEERRRGQAAETQRLADVQADLDRQQEALRLAQETVIAPSDPVEATADEDVQPSNIATIVATEKPARPSDAAIFEILVRALSVERSTVLGWLREMDLEALAEDEAATEAVLA